MYKKVLTACAGLILLVSGVAMAGVPCAGTTTVVATGSGSCTPGAAICPNGDMDLVNVTVTVMDCYGTPLADRMVLVSAAGATVADEFCYCPDGEAPPNENEDTKLVGPTNAAGVVTAQFRKYGGCGNQVFYATIGDVTAGPSIPIYIASPDNNNDCQVNLVDFGNFSLMYPPNPYDPCGDFNCDGNVNLVDFGTFSLHYTHNCTFPVP